MFLCFRVLGSVPPRFLFKVFGLERLWVCLKVCTVLKVFLLFVLCCLFFLGSVLPRFLFRSVWAGEVFVAFWIVVWCLTVFKVLFLNHSFLGRCRRDYFSKCLGRRGFYGFSRCSSFLVFFNMSLEVVKRFLFVFLSWVGAAEMYVLSVWAGEVFMCCTVFRCLCYGSSFVF